MLPLLNLKIMYQTKTGSYDTIPEGMMRYINNYGCHFNKKLSDEAARRMYRRVNGNKEYITPYTKEQVDSLLQSRNIKIERNKLYDSVYIANMCKADFLGSSISDEAHLALYIRDVLDDPDAEDGFIFNRFYADSIFMNNPIDWDSML